MAALTTKQENFVLFVVAGDKPTDAHVRAYPNKSSHKTHQEAASRLMKNSKVQARLAELRKPAAEDATMTLEGHLSDLQGLRNMAAKKGQYGAAISAEIARGRHAGVVVADKHEHAGKGGAPLAVPALTLVIEK